MRTDETIVTELMMRLCYNCPTVGECVTEQQCRQCFEENGLLAHPDEADAEMAELFRQYAL